MVSAALDLRAQAEEVPLGDWSLTRASMREALGEPLTRNFDRTFGYSAEVAGEPGVRWLEFNLAGTLISDRVDFDRSSWLVWVAVDEWVRASYPGQTTIRIGSNQRFAETTIETGDSRILHRLRDGRHELSFEAIGRD